MCESNGIEKKALAKTLTLPECDSDHPTLSESRPCPVPSIAGIWRPKRARSGCHSQNTRHRLIRHRKRVCLRVRASKNFEIKIPAPVVDEGEH